MARKIFMARKTSSRIQTASEKKAKDKRLLLEIRDFKKRNYELCFPNVFSRLFPNFCKSFTKGSKYTNRKPFVTNKSLIKKRRVAVQRLLLRAKARANPRNSLDSNKTQLPLNGKVLKSRFFFSKVITIRIKPNNVFCTFVNKANRKTISGTSTKYKVKMSKKALRYNYKVILKSFLKETKRFLKSKRILVSVTSPRKIRRELFRTLKTRLIRRKKFVQKASGKKIRYSPNLLLFRFNSKKCFNGCRVRKKRRKKQRGLRIYK
jgi:ribosomal protein S11